MVGDGKYLTGVEGLEMKNSLFYSAKEVQEILGVSRGKAYKVVQELNEQLEQRGFIVIAGKVPKQFFQEHFYGMALQQNAKIVGEASI